MHEKIVEQVAAVLETYVEPNEVRRMIEMVDHDGHDMFWYMNKYDIFGILDCRILDRIMSIKWFGPFEINVSFADYSTGYMLMADKHEIFASDRWFQETMHEMLTVDRSYQVHQFKFDVWKQSMYLRGMLDIGFSLFVVGWF